MTNAKVGRKQRAAALSIFSNSVLITLKLAAGVLTGSVAVITEALHSGIDLLAALITFVSVRKSNKPADESHSYGHEKIEHLTAAIEGMLILVGSGILIYESVRRLLSGVQLQHLGWAIAAIGASLVVNLGVSAHLSRTARATQSPALAGDAAHLRTDAYTSGGVFVGLILAELTGAAWLDAAVALVVAVAIVITGARIVLQSSRVLVDEALPQSEQELVRAVVMSFGKDGVVGFHKVRTRGSGARRYVDLHVQFRHGMSLQEAHMVAHNLQDAIAERLPNADVLIHLEPADKVRPGTEVL